MAGIDRKLKEASVMIEKILDRKFNGHVHLTSYNMKIDSLSGMQLRVYSKEKSGTITVGIYIPTAGSLFDKSNYKYLDLRAKITDNIGGGDALTVAKVRLARMAFEGAYNVLHNETPIPGLIDKDTIAITVSLEGFYEYKREEK